jgi:hypothetical protein
MEVHMRLLSFFLGKARRRASVATDAGKPESRSPGGAGDVDPPRDRPITPAELIAASAFVDFGGMFDERWLSGRGHEETDAPHHRK